MVEPSHVRAPRWRLAVQGLVVAAGVLLLLEAGTRLLFGAPPEEEARLLGAAVSDPDYGWRLEPGAPIVDQTLLSWERRWDLESPPDPTDRVSPEGFRDSALAWPKPPDQLRVLCVGDSSVYGQGTRADLRFSEVLERALNPDGSRDPARKRVEVINGGLGGWSSYQSLVQLERNLDLGLDAVVVYNLNSDLMVVEGGTADHVYFGRRRQTGALGALERLAMVQWGRHLRSGTSDPEEAGATDDGTSSSRRVPIPAYQQNLARFAELARDHDLGLVYVLPVQRRHLKDEPVPRAIADEAGAEAARAWLARPDDQRGPLRSYETAMALAAWQAGRPLVDSPTEMARRYQADPEAFAGPAELFADGIHPSRNGHALLAELILPALRSELERLQRPPHPATRAAPLAEASSPAAPPGPDPRPGAAGGPEAAEQRPVGVAGLVDLGGCAGKRTDADQVLVVGQVDAGSMPTRGRDGLAAPLVVALVEAGPDGGEARAFARCSPAGFSLAVPRSLGPVRLVAALDRDGDGPSWNDAVAVSDVIDLAGGAPAPLSLTLGSWAEAYPWGPPFDLALAARPLLLRLAQGAIDLSSTAYRSRGLSIATVIDPAVREQVDFAAQLGPVARSVETLGILGVLVDALDHPAAALADHDAWVVIEPLGGDLAGRAARALGERQVRVDHAWTDPQGLSWTLLTAALPPAQPASRRPGVLRQGQGWVRALAGEGPDLPPELQKP